MRIAIYGAGGVGGYFGGRLAQAGSDVHFIDRGAHLQAMREQGLRVQSVKGDFTVQVPATDDPAEVGPCDYVLFCVKAFDTEPAAARVGPLLGESTAVLSLQNGVDNEEKLATAIGPDHVMGGAAFIFAGKAAPGVIVHTGGPTSITFALGAEGSGLSCLVVMQADISGDESGKTMGGVRRHMFDAQSELVLIGPPH